MGNGERGKFAELQHFNVGENDASRKQLTTFFVILAIGGGEGCSDQADARPKGGSGNP